MIFLKIKIQILNIHQIMRIYVKLTQKDIEYVIKAETKIYGEITWEKAHIELKKGFDYDAIIRKYGNRKVSRYIGVHMGTEIYHFYTIE